MQITAIQITVYYIHYMGPQKAILSLKPVFIDLFKKNVDFWVCDATALPFSDGVFAKGISLNVLDCGSSPYDHLKELGRVLMDGGGAIVSTPYDWSASATAVGSWLGGHSQRAPNKGAAEAVLRSLLAGGGHPNAVEDLELISEKNIPWTLRLHDRSIMDYLVHMIVVQKNQDVDASDGYPADSILEMFFCSAIVHNPEPLNLCLNGQPRPHMPTMNCPVRTCTQGGVGTGGEKPRLPDYLHSYRDRKALFIGNLEFDCH